MAVTGIEKNGRRDQVTILSDLLVILQEPTKLTHVLYRSGMSYTQLTKYLTYLKELEMIGEKKKPFRAFIITEKGKAFMNLIKRKDEFGYDSLMKYPTE